MKTYKWVLGNSFFGLEKDAIESMADLCPISPIGPLVPPSLLGADKDHDTGVEMWKVEDTCIEWLNKGAPSSVIYVSFGSLVVLSAKQMECMAKALENSNSPFIWVPTNAKLIVDVFRIGLRLRANQDGIVSNEEVERCIREIKDGPKSVELKSNARELRIAAREAVAGGGSSDKNIQLFVDEIIESCGSIEISEVVNSMKDLIDYSRETGTGPMESLAKFPRRTSSSSGFHSQAPQPEGQQQQQ
ncbi:hypothetical protein H0E87_017442 [Populus deltoides]|uniref:Uncharacterized protein n=1 Tax=Populus deltoides TaxID=3696 RepID=A0A8T2Y0A2_POPDE|nr:hypothetical protein H0E87_017442 [Populus deltoides]